MSNKGKNIYANGTTANGIYGNSPNNRNLYQGQKQGSTKDRQHDMDLDKILNAMEKGHKVKGISPDFKFLAAGMGEAFQKIEAKNYNQILLPTLKSPL